MGKQGILISGAGGLIGRALSRHLSSRGYGVRRLVRQAPQSDSEFQWDPERGALDPAAFAGCCGVVHLAGEPLLGRWSPEKKAAILNSRVRGTQTLANSIAHSRNPPQVWISASAIGYYGDRGAEPLTEVSAPGKDFLSEVCQAWERETGPATSATRVVRARIGLVLSADGGTLREMLTPFNLGAGGKLGTGKQHMSWISLRDLTRAVEYCLKDDSLTGPVNFVGPQPTTNEHFTKVLGQVLRRPTLFTVPKLALRLRFGEFADGILASQKVNPTVLLKSGFVFEDPNLEGALRTLLVK